MIRLVRGWPTGPAVVCGSFVALAVLGGTVVREQAVLLGSLLLGAAVLGMLVFMRSAGQLVNHLNHGPPNWAQGAMGGVLTLALLVGTDLLATFTEPMITGPVLAVALGAAWAWGLTRWAGWVVREEQESPV